MVVHLLVHNIAKKRLSKMLNLKGDSMMHLNARLRFNVKKKKHFMLRLMI